MVHRRARSHVRLPLILVLVAGLFSAVLAAAPQTARPAAAASSFDDVPDGIWYSDAVAWLSSTGITTGTSPTTFSPGAPVTRAQMAAFIARYLQTDGTPGEHGFDDVPSGAYFDAAVSVLVDRGITTGTSATTYSPGSHVTRKQMATFLHRLSGEPDVDIANPFVDNPAGTWWYDAVRWLYAEGITTGTSDTEFSPDDNVTRAQMATFLWRLAGEPGTSDPGFNRADDDTTVIADEDDVEFTTLSQEGESEIEWTGDDVPDEGDVIVLDSTDETPDGFLGKVIDVDGDMVTTEPAVLQEVIPEGDFVTEIDLSEDEEGLLALQGAFDDIFDSAQMGCEAGATLDVTADTGITPTLTLSGSWSPGQGVTADVTLGVTFDATITAAVSGAISCSASIETEPRKLRKIKFYVGGIPVWIEPTITFFGEISANFEANASVTFEWNPTIGVSVGYDRGDWDVSYIEPTSTKPTLTPTFGGEAVLDIHIGTRLDTLMYGRGGPYATLGPFFTITAQTDDPWWAIDGGVRASVGASFDLWFWEGEVEFAEIDLFRFRLADALDSNQPFPVGDFVAPSVAQTTGISTGGSATCVIISGIVECVGRNREYQRGAGERTEESFNFFSHGRFTENDDPDGRPLDAIDVQMDNTIGCALYDDLQLRCWGTVPMPQPTDDHWHTPQLVPLPGPVRNFDISGTRVTDGGGGCAVLEDFTVWCWGDEMIGVTLFSSQAPADQGLDHVVDVAVTGTTRCFLFADGTVACKGGNEFGQLGDGTTAPRTDIEFVDGLADVVSISGGFGNICAVHRDGTVSCWGDNEHGHLGNGEYGDDTIATRPEPVIGLTDAIAVDIGYFHTCAIHATGEVSCWGYGINHSLMGGQFSSDAEQVTEPRTMISRTDAEPDAVQVTVGRASTCVRFADHTSKCWGFAYYGQLGNRFIDSTPTPQSVLAPL